DAAVVPSGERVEGLLEVGVGLLLELGDPDVAVAVAEVLVLDTLNADVLAGEREVEQVGDALPLDGDPHLAAAWTAHLLDGVHQRHVLGELLLDLDDLVARLDARPEGRGVLDRRDDRQDASAVRDLDPETAEA